MERGRKPNVEISPNCPRCGSCNTKFCYYNNYSLTQPRYFCKGCRRYWTKGGSLRNVPIGGGCRKSRRGKSLRLSNDAGQSRSLAYGRLPNYPMGETYGAKGNSLVDSTGSSMMPDGSHIDLALVFAKFLNQKPDSETGFELPEFPSDLDSALEPLNISNTNLSSGTKSVEDNGLFRFHTFSEVLSVEICASDNNQMYLCGSGSSQKHQDIGEPSLRYETSNFGLPQLPGEDIPSREALWSSSQMMLNHTFQGTQMTGLGQDAQDPNFLISDWSPVDLSSDQ